MLCCAHAVSRSLPPCRAHGEIKYDPGPWSVLLSGVAEHLGGIYEDFGAWLSMASTPEGVAFNNWWVE